MLLAMSILTENFYYDLFSYFLYGPQKDDPDFIKISAIFIILAGICMAVLLMISYFMFAAVIESYKKISLDFNNQRYLSRATLLYENIHAFNRRAVEKTPFLIEMKREIRDSS